MGIFSELKFGTDGWRSRTDVDFNDRNVMRVAAGILRYLDQSCPDQRGVFIGYDGRSSSRHFAECCAAVLASGGTECFLPPRPVPTPISAYAAVKHSLKGSIMITASHNPPEYNGIKFIPHYGGPATPEITGAIERLIPSRADLGPVPNSGPEHPLISELDPLPSYLAHLDRLIDIRGNSLNVFVDPMHGATAGIFDKILDHFGVRTSALRGNVDPLFGGGMPDPTPANLSRLQRSVVEAGADLGIALDGDGDRLAIVTDTGDFLMANQILPIVYLHFNDVRAIKGNAARTVATSHMIDNVCASRGFKAIEVPVGFKYIGALLRAGGATVGGEESGGISFAGHIPEKDGMASALMLLEHIHASGKPISAVMECLSRDYGPFVSSREDIRMDSLSKDVLQEIESSASSRIGGRIRSIGRMDGLKITFDDDAWLLFRKSGTENVVRIYAESRSSQRTASLLAFGRSLL